MLCLLWLYDNLLTWIDTFTHILQGCFSGTVAVVRLPQCHCSNPEGYAWYRPVCAKTQQNTTKRELCAYFLGYTSCFTVHELSLSLIWCVLIKQLCVFVTGSHSFDRSRYCLITRHGISRSGAHCISQGLAKRIINISHPLSTRLVLRFMQEIRNGTNHQNLRNSFSNNLKGSMTSLKRTSEFLKEKTYGFSCKKNISL